MGDGGAGGDGYDGRRLEHGDGLHDGDRGSCDDVKM